MVADRRRDRGQLILIGCLSVALVVIGIGLVINTTLYTESASPALSNVQVEDAETFNLETRRGTRSLVHRLNLGDPERGNGELETIVTDGVENYSELLAVSYARTEPATVDVSYDHDDSEVGTRLIQQRDDEFDDEHLSELDPENQAFGWFMMNVNVSETGAISPFAVTIEGDDGDEVDWEINRNETGVESNLTVETRHDGVTRTAHCNPRQNRVLIDGVSGTIVADGCTGDETVFGIESLAAPHDVTSVERNAEYVGQWELVTEEPEGVGDVPSCDAESPEPDKTEACYTPAVWSAHLEASYDGEDATFDRDRNVSVYGGGS